MSKRFHDVAMALGTTAAALIVWGVSSWLVAQEGPAFAGDPNAPEVLTRGPVHEAFAEVVNYNPKAGEVVAKQPPAPIEEMPPTEKPTGDYIWIPGYWAWDAERDNYIWISGVWRLPPPGTTWVPGYWSQAATGYQWVSGYWGPATVAGGRQTVETEYLPPPPQSVESGPVGVAPGDQYFWIPGCWKWVGDRYVWRPGRWWTAYDNWIWIPDRYVWTPAGYVFIAGHWDYSLDQRGIAFCPVYYPRPYYMPPGYYFSPSICIEAGVLHGYLFCRPAWGHYYFGDYYDPAFVRFGFYPCFGVSVGIGYEPFYVHDRWYYRHDPMWERRQREDYAYRYGHPEARPPHTYALAVRWNGGPGGVRVSFGTPVSHVAAGGHGAMHFERVSPERRQQMVREQHEVRQVQQQRHSMEAKAHADARGGAPTKPVHMSINSAQSTSSHSVGTQQGKGGAVAAGPKSGPSGTPAAGNRAGVSGPGRPAATTPGRQAPATNNSRGSSSSKDKDKDRKNN
jgi:hypothetical protein